MARLRGMHGLSASARCAAYLCDEPNPVLQLLYLLLVGGGYGLAVADMYPRVPCAALGPHHRPAALALVLFCLGTWAKACTAPPGYVVDAATFASCFQQQLRAHTEQMRLRVRIGELSEQLLAAPALAAPSVAWCDVDCIRRVPE